MRVVDCGGPNAQHFGRYSVDTGETVYTVSDRGMAHEGVS